MKTKTIEDRGQNHVDVLKSLESSDKQLTTIKDFISKERLNPEKKNKVERIEEEEIKVDRSRMANKTKHITKNLILENLIQYMFLVVILKIILLI